MNSFANIFFQFLFMLSAGSIAFLPLVQSKLTGVGHSKLIILISLVLSFIASLGFGLSFLDINFLSATTAVHGFLLLMMWIRHKEVRGIEIYIYYILAMLSCFLFFINLPFDAWNRLFIFNCCLILGLINYIMILGHYYLVVPKLTVRPLLLGLKIYWFILGIKLILIYPFDGIINFWQTFYQAMFRGAAVSTPIDVSELALIFFQQISEYVANPIISYFAYRLCLLRSTQSATGLFYVMVFFALISEMLSIYLLYTKGIRI